MSVSFYMPEVAELAGKMERADAGEWIDVLIKARREGWEGPPPRDVQPSKWFRLRKDGKIVAVLMGADEGGICPMEVRVGFERRAWPLPKREGPWVVVRRQEQNGSMGWSTWHLTRWGARRAASLFTRTGETRGYKP